MQASSIWSYCRHHSQPAAINLPVICGASGFPTTSTTVLLILHEIFSLLDSILLMMQGQTFRTFLIRIAVSASTARRWNKYHVVRLPATCTTSSNDTKLMPTARLLLYGGHGPQPLKKMDLSGGQITFRYCASTSCVLSTWLVVSRSSGNMTLWRSKCGMCRSHVLFGGPKIPLVTSFVTGKYGEIPIIQKRIATSNSIFEDRDTLSTVCLLFMSLSPQGIWLKTGDQTLFHVRYARYCLSSLWGT